VCPLIRQASAIWGSITDETRAHIKRFSDFQVDLHVNIYVIPTGENKKIKQVINVFSVDFKKQMRLFVTGRLMNL
jgi:hypothetical protein